MTAGPIATNCPYCSLQCGISLAGRDDGTIELTGRDDPVNRGGLCIKGANAAELLGHPERLRTPLVRDVRGGPLRPAGWDEALPPAPRDSTRSAGRCAPTGRTASSAPPESRSPRSPKRCARWPPPAPR
ncbi:MAG: hypothetical protein ACRDRQ_22605 [Pseudonocardiaceae bacterium]